MISCVIPQRWTNYVKTTDTHSVQSYLVLKLSTAHTLANHILDPGVNCPIIGKYTLKEAGLSFSRLCPVRMFPTVAINEQQCVNVATEVDREG